METKTAIRNRLRRLRGEMTENETAQKSARICERVHDVLLKMRADKVFVYSAVRGEADLTPLIRKLWARGICAAFPRCSGTDMSFYRVDSADELRRGTFGILEPSPDCELMLPDGDTVVLVPGTAFSESGARIGMGGGYYDRYFSEHPFVQKIGIAYELQIQKEWETEPWDISMDRIITECMDRIIM